MKKQCFILLAGLSVATAALAVDKFDALIKANNNTGKEKTYTFTLVLDDAKAEQLTGEIFSYGSGPCGKERKITGTQKTDGEIQFRTEEGELKGCGKLVFKGRWENSAIVGMMRFQGEDKEFIFKK